MSELLERLRDMAAGKNDDLSVAAEAIQEIIDLHWQIVGLEKERDELRDEISEDAAAERAQRRRTAMRYVAWVLIWTAAGIVGHSLGVAAAEWTLRLDDTLPKEEL